MRRRIAPHAPGLVGPSVADPVHTPGPRITPAPLEPRTRQPEPEFSARLEAIEEWTQEASEASNRLESKVLWSLLALESRINRTRGAEDADRPRQAPGQSQAQSEEPAARAEERISHRLQALEGEVVRANHNLELVAELASRMLKDSAGQRQEVSDLTEAVAALRSRLGGLESKISRLAETSSQQNQQIHSELLGRFQEIQSTVGSRMDNLQQMVEGTTRSGIGLTRRLLDAFEELAHKTDGLMHAVEEARTEAIGTAKRTDGRMLRALEALEGRIAELQGTRLPSPRIAPGDHLGAARRRQEQLVEQLLAPAEPEL